MTSNVAVPTFLERTAIAEVPEDWEVVRLGQLYSERKERGVPGLPVMSVTLDQGLVPRDSLDRRVESGLEPSEHALARTGDLVYNTMRMWQGASGIASTDCLVSPAYVVAAPSDRISPFFAPYLLKAPSVVGSLYSYSHGITRDRLRLYFDNFAEVPVPLPPLPEQQKIAAILSSVDDGIAATRKVIERAKRLKLGLLQTLMTRGIGHTLFQETEIGEIPEAWNVIDLQGALQQGPRNGIYKTTEEIGSGSLIVGQTAITKERRLDFSEARRANLTEAEIATWGLAPGDVLLTRVYATPDGCGRPAFVDAPPEPAVYESNMIRVRPKAEVLLGLFLFYWLQVTRVRAHLMARSSSSNQTSINQKTIQRLPVALPTLREQRAIVELLEGLESHRELGRAEKDRLDALKRGLMQDLLIGRVRVKRD